MTEKSDKNNPLFQWTAADPDDYRMWCYAGGRRYLFADCVVETGKGFRGWIYDVDLDSFNASDVSVDAMDAEYIESCTEDYDRACAIADCIDHTRETELYGSEEELWSGVREIRL